MSKAKEIDNWREFDVCEALCNSLVANKFKEPTTVQKESLVYLNAHTDMVIAAKTGQGKTLTFGIPILDLLLRRLSKFGHEDDEFDSVKALIMAPTRELTIQIKEHIEAIVPSQNAKQIKVCAIVGGMSIQKQLRLLSYKPTIIVATPGRLWELMSDHNNDYLNKGLPLIDVLVLDEADRMIADGHFKEMRDILAHIYTSRVSIKRPKKEGDDKVEEVKLSEQYKECVELGDEFFVSKHSTRPDIDLSKVQDLYDEDAILNDMQENLVFEAGEKVDLTKRNKGKQQKKDESEEEEVEEEEGRMSKKKKKVVARLSKEKLEELDKEKFDIEYYKSGGIQHIICSATLTINEKGRMTPRSVKALKRKIQKEKDAAAKAAKGKKGKPGPEPAPVENAVEAICKVVKFRSKTPKVINLTEQERLPATLIEKAIRCKNDEKDVYMFYYLQQKGGESTIIFCNSITCVMRVSSMLSFLKIKNYALHSKMQQRARLKSLDRFKSAVQKIDVGESLTMKDSAIMVCTDVAARGLDIPNVQNVLHYQSPFNAEIYVHRSGRTARIGMPGEALALLAPEDEKTFRQMQAILKKDASSVEMLDVKYTQIQRLVPIVKAATECEKNIHQKDSADKQAQWLLKMAQDGDLGLDDDMKAQIGDTLEASGKRKKLSETQAEFIDDEIQHFKSYDDAGEKRRDKDSQKAEALRKKYDKAKENEQSKRFSKSAYLTPESVRYLNDLMKTKDSAVDQELVYAGLHNENAGKLKQKKVEKNKQKYKGRIKSSNKAKGRASRKGGKKGR